MINPGHKLSISRQAELLEMSRSTIYYRPRPVSDADLLLMRRISWATPAPITYGTQLCATQLNARASTPGSFVYTPPAGTRLAAGSQTLSAKFTPTDSVNYTTATFTVNLTVNKAPQAIAFMQPATPVTYGVKPISLAATANSGLAVNLSVLPGPAKVSGTTLTITGTGSVIVAANQAGNADYSVLDTLPPHSRIAIGTSPIMTDFEIG